MRYKKELKIMVNKGKKCLAEGCNFSARTKNYCLNCYNRIIVKKRKKDFSNCS